MDTAMGNESANRVQCENEHLETETYIEHFLYEYVFSVQS